tara:strand:- start:917 stop:1168 length:252 start_codon:yes stop_codon:yes gene_type:complete
MMKVFSKIMIGIIKVYQIFVSPFLTPSCRYLPTCSEYFIDCLKTFGFLKGTSLGIKRLLSCHPIKFLGGGEGYDPVKNFKVKK